MRKPAARLPNHGEATSEKLQQNYTSQLFFGVVTVHKTSAPTITMARQSTSAREQQ
jgi:hypothetical protein